MEEDRRSLVAGKRMGQLVIVRAEREVKEREENSHQCFWLPVDWKMVAKGKVVVEGKALRNWI